MVYYSLENVWRINETYGYYPEFEEVVLVMEGGFPFSSFYHPNKIKS